MWINVVDKEPPKEKKIAFLMKYVLSDGKFSFDASCIKGKFSKDFDYEEAWWMELPN